MTTSEDAPSPDEVVAPEVMALRDDLAHARAALPGLERRAARLEADLERALADGAAIEVLRQAAVDRAVAVEQQLAEVCAELAEVHGSKLWLVARVYRRLRRSLAR